MGDLAPDDEKDDKIIPLGEGYGTDPYNQDAICEAIATIRGACESRGHRCIIAVEPIDAPFFFGHVGSNEWLHFMGGRIMTLAVEEHAEKLESFDLEWSNDE